MRRTGIITVSTIAKPEKIAPATKYGAKIVACQPGTSDIAKSQDTTQCTESTSGVARPERCSTVRLCAFHCRDVPCQPSASERVEHLAPAGGAIARDREIRDQADEEEDDRRSACRS